MYRPTLHPGATMAKTKKTEAAEPEAAGSEAPAEKPTQKDAVKAALAAGKVLPTEGVAFVQEKFGITLNNAAFSTLKTQLKKASGATPAKAKPGRKPGRPSTNGPVVAAAHVGNGKANPADLVRGLKGLIATFGVGVVKEMAEALAE